MALVAWPAATATWRMLSFTSRASCWAPMVWRLKNWSASAISPISSRTSELGTSIRVSPAASADIAMESRRSRPATLPPT